MNSEKKYFAWSLALAAALALVLICAVYIYEALKLGGISPTLDDTYIHLRFARNLASGEGFCFNPGEIVPGTTSPLWVLLLSVFGFGSKSFLVKSSLWLSALSYAAVPPLAFVLARRIGVKKPFDLTAAALVALNGRVLWAGSSGMETDLFAVLSAVSILLLVKDEEKGKMGAATGAFLGLATLARPEGYLLFLVSTLHFMARVSIKDEGTILSRLMRAIPWSALAVYAALVLPYIVFAFVTTGHPMPSTYVAKQHDLLRERGRYLYWSTWYFWMDNPVVSILVIAALFRSVWLTVKTRLGYLTSGEGAVALWAFGHYAASMILTPMPYHFCRYQIPVLPFFLVLAARLAETAVNYFKTPSPEAGGEAETKTGLVARYAPLAAALLMVAPGVYGLYRWPKIIVNCADEINSMHVAIASCLSEITSEDSVIATMDIGAIGFYTDRKVIDIVGLVTPEVVPYVKGKGMTEARSKSLLGYLSDKKPDYLALFPKTYPGLADDGSVFVPLFDRSFPETQIVASNWMVVYKCLWQYYKEDEGPPSEKPPEEPR